MYAGRQYRLPDRSEVLHVPAWLQNCVIQPGINQIALRFQFACVMWHVGQQRMQHRIEYKPFNRLLAGKIDHRAPKSTRCQRMNVSGRKTVRTCSIEGNRRYGWIKNKRSWLVSRTGRRWSAFDRWPRLN